MVEQNWREKLTANIGGNLGGDENVVGEFCVTHLLSWGFGPYHSLLQITNYFCRLGGCFYAYAVNAKQDDTRACRRFEI